MKLLHIVATPRTNSSNTLKISNTLINKLETFYTDLTVSTLDLFNSEVPAMAGDRIESKYILMRGGELQPDMRTTWDDIESTSAGFLSADMYMITAPMWNFSIPYALKYYIDTIVQPGYLFKYQEDGTPVGLASGKMFVVTTSGSDYSPNSPMYKFNFFEPYLRSIFGFCGITDISFITASNMDITPEMREMSIDNAINVQIPSLLEVLSA